MHAMHLIFAIISVLFIAVTNARPNQFGSKNVVTVPPNCPEGQVWINNQCRDLWDTFQKTMMFPDSAVEVVPQNIPQDAFDNEEKVNIENQKNVVTVPPNCPPGQIWINGACRDIWALMSDDQDFLPSNVVVVPPNCPPGQVWMNGACRNRWSIMLNDQQSKNVIVVPPNCPPGQVWMNGACRNWWSMILNDQQSKNVIVVPPNCPSGTVLIGGHCRPIWRTDFSEAEEPSMEKNEIMTDKGVVTVPNHCPVGYRPDALGICRRIF